MLVVYKGKINEDGIYYGSPMAKTYATAIAAYEQSCTKLMTCELGAAIIEKLKNSKCLFHVVVKLIGTGGGQFATGTNYYPEITEAHAVIEWAPADFQYYVKDAQGLYKKTISKKPDEQRTRWTLTNVGPEIALGHEMGHAIQYLEDYGGDGNAFLEAYIKDGGAAIELDNLMRHENPLCDQLGYPRRAKYGHSKEGTLSKKLKKVNM